MTEMRKAILGLAGAVTAADDQAQAMTDAELGALLTSGRWSTIEVHEAGRRLLASTTRPEAAPSSEGDINARQRSEATANSRPDDRVTPSGSLPDTATQDDGHE